MFSWLVMRDASHRRIGTMGRSLTHVGGRGEGLVLVEEGEHLRPAHGLGFFRDGGLLKRRAKSMGKP